MENNQKYMCSITEGARIFSLGRDRLYRLARTNEIPCFVKVGLTTKIIIPRMQEFLDKAAREGIKL
jgi:hypothetical protein